MLDSRLDRLITYRTGLVADLWGQRRIVARGSRDGLWYLDSRDLDERPAQPDPALATPDRAVLLAVFAESGRFTSTELATLRALVVDHLTINEIAERDGCSRQAVLARLTGNSRGQGGVLKKARAMRAATSAGAPE